MTKKILTGPDIFTNDKKRPFIKSGALLIDDEKIIDVGDYQDIKKKNPNVNIEDIGIGLLTPGLVNLHHHLYSSLARGWSPKGTAPENFLQILEKIWWKLDKALELDDIYLSAIVGLCESARMGVTSVVDHHASQNNVIGSLDEISKAYKKVGLKGSICFELSDRGGDKIFEAGLKETVSTLEKWQEYSSENRIKAMIGLHASMTLSENSLRKISEATKQYNCGYHFHLAEDKSDQDDSLAKYGLRVVYRFAKHGMLGEKSLAIHGVHLDEEEVKLLKETGTNLILCPRSNQNNAVGFAKWWDCKIANLGLGTDGIGSDMINEAKSALYLSRHISGNPNIGFNEIENMLLNNNPDIFEKLTGCKVGRLNAGYSADMVLWDYNSPTPLNKNNVWGHYLYGLYNHQADSVWVDGDKIIENGDFTKLDYKELVYNAELSARKLGERI